MTTVIIKRVAAPELRGVPRNGNLDNQAMVYRWNTYADGKLVGSDAMPVCLAGDRLEFTVRTVLTIRHGGTWITREEPEGASWDGATIPRWLWSIAGHPLEQRWRWASYWHDRLCEDATCIEDRTIADAVFLRLLRSAGIVRWRRLAMWAAVRFYGLFIWRAKV